MPKLKKAHPDQIVSEFFLKKDLFLTFLDEVYAPVNIVNQRELNALWTFQIDNDEKLKKFPHFAWSECIILNFLQPKHNDTDLIVSLRASHNDRQRVLDGSLVLVDVLLH